ncbi:MAG: hypothetical protein ABIO45_11865 [Burkholderiaceae bacterium]
MNPRPARPVRPRRRPGHPTRPSAWPWRLLRGIALGLVALWLLFEEFGWRPLAAWLGKLAEWPPWARLEARVCAASPRAALVFFLVPAGLLLPVKLIALHLMQGGRPLAGMAVILAAKLIGTAIGGRIYLLARPALMTMPRFARAVAWWRLMRARVRHALRVSRGWQAVQRAVQSVRARL